MQDDFQRYHIHFSLANDVMFSYDKQLRIISISENVERVLGYRPEELIGRPIQETGVFHADSLDAAKQNALRVLSGDTIPSSLYRFVARDGGIRYGEVSGVPLTRDGRVVGVISVARDITERIRTEEELRRYRENLENMVSERTAELTRANERLAREIEERRRVQDALKESERKARAVFDQTFQLIGLMTTEGILIEANRTALEFSGIDESDVIGRPFWETPWWVHDATRQKRLRSAVRKCARGEFIRFEATHPSRDGGLRTIDFSLKPVTDEHGRVIYLIPEGRDITDRKTMEEELKRHRNHLESLVRERTADLVRANEHLEQEIAERSRAEEALRQSEEHYRTHFSLTSDVMYVLDDQFRVVSVSPSVENSLGYRPEELIGHPFQELGVLEPAYLVKASEDCTRVLSGKRIGTSVYRFITKDGERRYGEVSGVPLMRGGRAVGIISLARDITHRVHDEEELKRHRVHLEELVRERTAELTRANDRLKREIRKQKRTEESLKDRQAWLDSIFRAAPIAIGVSKGRVLQEVNDRACEMTGYARGELIGRSSRILYLSQKDFELVSTEKRRQYAERGTGYMETRWKRKDGGIIDILLSSTPIVPGDPAAGVMFTALDITERKRSENALRRSEEYLRAITANLPGVVFQAYARENGEHGLYYVSERSQEILGLDCDTENYFQRILACLEPTDRKAMVASIREAVRTVSRWDYETRFVRPTGEVMYARCLSQTRRHRDEIVFNGILLDVTEQRLAEEALKESHRHIQRQMLFLEAMLSAIPTPVFFKDTEGRYLGCNQAFSDLFGITPGELRGKTAYEILPEKLAQAHHGKDLELLQTPGIQTYEWKVRDKDRQMRDVIFGKNVFRDENGEVAGIVGAFIDITELKRTQDELTRHRDSLEEMVRERTEDLTRTYERLRQENEARKVTEEVLRARERDLELKQADLEDMNSALKVLLDRREEDRSHLEENIITNIKTSVLPFLEKLKATALRESQRAYLSEIELHLSEIASSYIKNLSSEHIGLSPSEIQVASLIKEGKSSKQIAELLNVSLNTVMTHRFCIRRKTGLKGRKVNLISYLQTLK